MAGHVLLVEDEPEVRPTDRQLAQLAEITSALRSHLHPEPNEHATADKESNA